MRVKCWKVAYWNAQTLLKNGQKSKNLLLKFKTCCQNFCILLYKRQFKAFFLVVHNNYFHRSRKVIFGMNTTSDISKLLYVISRAVRRVKFGTIWKYHEWYLFMLLFFYTTTRKRFVIFTCRYFKLSWNTTALSQSNCRNFSCNSIRGEIFKSIIKYSYCNSCVFWPAERRYVLRGW